MLPVNHGCNRRRCSSRSRSFSSPPRSAATSPAGFGSRPCSASWPPACCSATSRSLGFGGLDYLKTDASIDMLAQLGVIILLFEVGLESTVAQMMKVGLSSFLVATLGVVGPFVLGWAVGAWLLPDAGIYAHIFLGATLTATSVGITARVLKDLGRSQTERSAHHPRRGGHRRRAGPGDPRGRDRHHRGRQPGRRRCRTRRSAW